MADIVKSITLENLNCSFIFSLCWLSWSNIENKLIFFPICLTVAVITYVICSASASPQPGQVSALTEREYELLLSLPQ